MKHLFLLSLLSIFLCTICAEEKSFTFPIEEQTSAGTLIVENLDIQFNIPDELPSIFVEKNFIDIFIKTGTKIFATTEGEAKEVKYETEKGNCFELNNKNMSFVYQHLRSFKIKNNEKILEGQIVGFSGNTGSTKEEKLRLEIIKGHKNDESLNSDKVSKLSFSKPVITIPTIKANNITNKTDDIASKVYLNWDSLNFIIEFSDKSPILKVNNNFLEIIYDEECEFFSPENSYIKKVNFDKKTQTYTIILKADKTEYHFKGLTSICISKKQKLQKGQKIGDGKQIVFFLK